MAPTTSVSGQSGAQQTPRQADIVTQASKIDRRGVREQQQRQSHFGQYLNYFTAWRDRYQSQPVRANHHADDHKHDGHGDRPAAEQDANPTVHREQDCQ